MDHTSETKNMASRPLPRDVSRPEQIRQAPHIHPPVDILDRADEILIRADMPGVPPEGIDVRYDHGILSISGKAAESEPKMRDTLLGEFERVDYFRQFSIGEGIDQGKISAQMDSGVLTLRLPKAESTQPKRIDVTKK